MSALELCYVLWGSHLPGSFLVIDFAKHSPTIQLFFQSQSLQPPWQPSLSRIPSFQPAWRQPDSRPASHQASSRPRQSRDSWTSIQETVLAWLGVYDIQSHQVLHQWSGCLLLLVSGRWSGRFLLPVSSQQSGHFLLLMLHQPPEGFGLLRRPQRSFAFTTGLQRGSTLVFCFPSPLGCPEFFCITPVLQFPGHLSLNISSRPPSTLPGSTWTVFHLPHSPAPRPVAGCWLAQCDCLLKADITTLCKIWLYWNKYNNNKENATNVFTGC